MRKFINAALLGGLLIFVIGAFLSARCLYSSTDLQFIDLAFLFCGAVTSLIAYFIRLKIKEGAPIFKLTEKDRKEIRDFRTELSPRNILIRLLTYFGVLFVLAGCALVFHDLFVESNKRTAWLAKMILIGSGVTCILLAISLSKRK